MYVLDGLNGAPMTELNPEEFGFTLKDGIFLPSSSHHRILLRHIGHWFAIVANVHE